MNARGRRALRVGKWHVAHARHHARRVRLTLPCITKPFLVGIRRIRSNSILPIQRPRAISPSVALFGAHADRFSSFPRGQSLQPRVGKRAPYGSVACTTFAVTGVVAVFNRERSALSSRRLCGLVRRLHANSNDNARETCQSGHRPHRGCDAKKIGDHA